MQNLIKVPHLYEHQMLAVQVYPGLRGFPTCGIFGANMGKSWVYWENGSPYNMEEMASLDGGGPFPLPSQGYLRRDRDGASFLSFQETQIVATSLPHTHSIILLSSAFKLHHFIEMTFLETNDFFVSKSNGSPVSTADPFLCSSLLSVA